jgi:hypothetical protein
MVQVVVAIIGLIGTVVGVLGPFIVERLKGKPTSPRPEPANGSTVSGVARAPGFDGRASRLGRVRPRSLLDLSIVMLWAAFFSTLMADSLLISGQVPEPSLPVLAEILAIALVTALVLFIAWLVRRSELGIGIMAVTTFSVLLLSPGGPLISAARNGEVGLSLYFPVTSLTLLASSWAIYQFGDPLDKDQPLRSRRRAIFLLALFLLVSSVTLGHQLVSSVSKDRRTPRLVGDREQRAAASLLLDKVRARDLKDRGLLYKLGSEVALSKYYQSGYFQGPKSLEPGAPGPETVGVQERAKVVAAQEDYLRALDPKSQLSYLGDRLRWVHPTVTAGNVQLNVPLPGINPQERFAKISELRILHALITQPFLTEDFPSLFLYPESISTHFRTDEGGLRYTGVAKKKRALNLPAMPGSEEKKAEEDRSEEDIFPELPARSYESIIHKQLALPILYDSYLTYSIYWTLAPTLASPKVRASRYAFDTQLGPANRRAVIKYIAEPHGSKDGPGRLDLLTHVEDGLAKAKLSAPDLGDSLTAATNVAARLNPDGTVPPPRRATQQEEKAAGVLTQALQDDAEQRRSLAEFLASEIPQYPMRDLIQEATLKYLKDVKVSLTQDERTELFDLLADPVTPVVREMARSLPPFAGGDQKWLGEQFHDFEGLMPENRNALLHYTAIATYSAEGPNSLGPLSLLIFQAQSLSDWIALACAMVLVLPLMLAAVILGRFVSRKLIERDRARDLIRDELARQKDRSYDIDVPEPVELQGRREFIERMIRLSGRGWSTIALVGRRGIGKSRILLELYKRSTDASRDFAISVWIASPSRFDEEDFIESTFEQLALSAEHAVARQLGAKPFAVRQLESTMTKAGLAVFALTCMMNIYCFMLIYQRLSRAEVLISWLPILLLAGCSAGCLITHLAWLQPLDLSPWLERDRLRGQHTVLLYRRTREALDYIRSRKSMGLRMAAFARGSGNSYAKGLIAGLVVCSALTYVSFIPTLVSFNLACFVGYYVAQRSRARSPMLMGREGWSEGGMSLMSLIAEYRDFATTAVSRLELGALEQHGLPPKTRVMICIDELDKIIDLGEIRGFLRRMKAIFEVPGIYYYVSLSEDTLAALYLGPAEGKNELDSSLDHIVRLPPLTWDEAHAVASSYLKRRGAEAIKPEIVDSLVAVSFGVPRDIIRRCDEFLANDGADAMGAAHLLHEIRRDQIELAAQSFAWTEPRCHSLLGDKAEVARQIRHDLEAESPVAEWRVLVMLWILCCLEDSAGRDGDERRRLMNRLCDLGYNLTLNPSSNILSEMERIAANGFPGPTPV